MDFSFRKRRDEVHNAKRCSGECERQYDQAELGKKLANESGGR
jgi:hypothetical protein